MKNIDKNWRRYVPFMLLDIILAQWRHPVASSEVLDLLHQAMRAVLYRRTTMAIKMASKVGARFHCCFVCCHPSGFRGNMERVLARWQCPVASGVALDMLHRAMHTHSTSASARRPSEWAAMEVHLIVINDFAIIMNLAI
jgi:hypothetical protein